LLPRENGLGEEKETTHISAGFFCSLVVAFLAVFLKICTLSFAFYVISTYSLEHIGNHAQNSVFDYRTQWLISLVSNNSALNHEIKKKLF